MDRAVSVTDNGISAYFVVINDLGYDLPGNKNGLAFMFQSTNKILDVCKFIANV
jgi:hypothetical protein